MYKVEQIFSKLFIRIDFVLTAKPKAVFTFLGNRKHITAPGFLYLTLIIDSFPSYNVLMFHKTNNLRTQSNVAGRYSFTTSMRSS